MLGLSRTAIQADHALVCSDRFENQVDLWFPLSCYKPTPSSLRQGNKRAAYGQSQLKQLAEQLQAEFGKWFYERNLRIMRSFYQAYPIWSAVRSKLSWTHYRILLRIENNTAREWYLQECIDHNWSRLYFGRCYH